MFVPETFRLDAPETLHRVMSDYPFATLVTQHQGRLAADHLPTLVHIEPAPYGRIQFHIVATNPVALALERSDDALLVYTAANAYISPDWFQSEGRVPTWNYVAVHAYGPARRLDADALVEALDALSAKHESSLAKPPWRSDKLGDERFARARRAIIGYEVTVRELVGKAKLGQNRSDADRQAAAQALTSVDTPFAAQISRWMIDGIAD